MAGKRTSLRPTSKAAWAAANDRGPHLAVLPTGKVVRFQLADSAMLLRSEKLPEQLRIVAQLAAAHSDGAEGYIQDLVQTAIIRGEDASATIAATIAQGVELSHYLVAEMLVEPEVTPEEVASGMFHELDIRMLLEFAERRRNVDHAGNVLPIMVLDLERWATFRYSSPDTAGTRDGGANGADVPGDVSDTDGGDL